MFLTGPFVEGLAVRVSLGLMAAVAEGHAERLPSGSWRAAVYAGADPLTGVGFYRYAVEEELLEHSPAVRVRRPGLITSPTPLASTATKWVHSWPPPGPDLLPSTP